MIWTTTPWTLPANLAIAVHADSEYALVRVDGNVSIIAKDLVEKVTKAAAAEDVKILATVKGAKLVGQRYRHPFVDLARDESVAKGATKTVFTVLPAAYVTLEDGTGLVHTAPGHGTEDYATGKNHGLPVYCPVRQDGTYDDTVPAFLRGLNIWKANDLVVQSLRDSGHLFYDHKFTHSYPHDWRGKTPVIFRCTEQWFISVDQPTKRDRVSLRQLGLDAVAFDPAGPTTTPAQSQAAKEYEQSAQEVERRLKTERSAMMYSPSGFESPTRSSIRFVPEWGRNRMRGMLESRPDWCISRQRSWGLPIPAFFTPEGQVFMTAASVRAVAKVVREKGSDVWFNASTSELLKHYDPATDPDAPAQFKGGTFEGLKKGPDILDVWFESGSSWNAVMRERSGGKDFPTDLYLEGSDQHRGWFQSSLLPSLGATGKSPFKTLLTHGFLVDKDGRKMSKSLGNALEVEDLLKDLGADVCRWWVASLSYEADIKVDRSYFDVAGDSYRKIRNTLRFMLSNLDDVPGPVATQGNGVFAPTTLEAWVLSRFDSLSTAVQSAYTNYDFQTAQKLLYDFCNDTLSATYLAAIKDRLYCDKADSPRRRRTQAALYHLTDGLCRLLAPILCHTADETFRALRKTDPADPTCCIHLETFLPLSGVIANRDWDRVFAVLAQAQVALEQSKSSPAEGGLGVENPLDAGGSFPDLDGALSKFDPVDLADLLGVSRVQIDPSVTSPRILDLRDQPRCDRSWKRDGTVKKRSDGGTLSDRDAEAVGVT